ncbi:MAG: methionine biosynthesis protein MetW [Candidatus Promineofilum sp.]|nr:methionine biosynthesis protein MetW [Promineifilum sp.]MBP9657334.1 methionine biosynthesis protein MetW [Promineifilum sp.]
MRRTGAGEQRSRGAGEQRRNSGTTLRPDLRIVAENIPAGSSALDLGCGDGALLEYLKIVKGVTGRGIERSEAGVLACVRRGLSVRQGNLQEGLADYPDKSFDVVILSQTLQYLNDPLMILEEMLRVGRLAVVSFPNLGHWRCRIHLLTGGRTPQAPDYPQSWYEAPRRQHFTTTDFLDFCHTQAITVRQAIYLSGERNVEWMPNLLARTAVFTLARTG